MLNPKNRPSEMPLKGKFSFFRVIEPVVKHGFKPYGIAFLIINYLTFLYAFLTAYFSGNMTVLIGIDWYNEAYFEFWLFVIIEPLILLCWLCEDIKIQKTL